MNQKDYKSIAGIMKFNKDNSYDAGSKLLDFVSNQLADYFEESDDIDGCNCARCEKNRFNRQQFLKMCGVEK